MGAVPVIGDVYDEVQLARWVAESEAEVVIHQLTAFGTKDGDPYAETIRVRIEGRAISYRGRAPLGASIHRAEHFVHVFAVRQWTYRRRNSALPRFSSGCSSTGGSHRVARTSNTGRKKRNVRYRPPVRMVLRPGTSYDPEGSIPRAILHGHDAIVGAGAGLIRSSICVTLPRQRSRLWRTKQAESTTSLMTRLLD